MFVLAHVSSIKTRRSGFRCGCFRRGSSRLSATSGRSLSEAMRTFFESQTKPLQRDAQRRNRQVRPKFPLQFLEGQIRLALDDIFDWIRECRPERHTPPLQRRCGLVEFSTLLLDMPNPGLAHVKARCNLSGASAHVARCEHLHACVTHGVFVPPAAAPAGDAPPVFIPARPITQADLATLSEKVGRRVVRWFRSEARRTPLQTGKACGKGTACGVRETGACHS